MCRGKGSGDVKAYFRMCNTDVRVDYWVIICKMCFTCTCVCNYALMSVEQPHLFEQGEDVNWEEAHRSRDDKAGLL